MVSPKPALWTLLLLVLLGSSAQCWTGHRSCHIAEVLRYYRAIIFQDLQAAMRKERSILLSIESLGRTLRGAMAGVRRGALEKAAWMVVVRTEAVMRRHCWIPRQQSRRPRTRPALRGHGRERRLLRALSTVATCWEKLFALRAMTTPRPSAQGIRT